MKDREIDAMICDLLEAIDYDIYKSYKRLGSRRWT